ncbi:MAG: hypothetical protein KF830_01230 [Planctomycetes bacterium]|nr:hypothetical protein [Planctomycetota bacterium]
MGHSEMLLAVAGLPENDVEGLAQRLARGEWTTFAPEERIAFAAAHRLSRAPASFSADDRALLAATFGAERAADLVYHVAWCNYMTRFADAFQLPLERTNVFAELAERAAREVRHDR